MDICREASGAWALWFSGKQGHCGGFVVQRGGGCISQSLLTPCFPRTWFYSKPWFSHRLLRDSLSAWSGPLLIALRWRGYVTSSFLPHGRTQEGARLMPACQRLESRCTDLYSQTTTQRRGKPSSLHFFAIKWFYILPDWKKATFLFFFLALTKKIGCWVKTLTVLLSLIFYCLRFTSFLLKDWYKTVRQTSLHHAHFCWPKDRLR